MSHESFYRGNDAYSNFLNRQDNEIFRKYVDLIQRFTKAGDTVLDVGCGAGNMLELARKQMPDRIFSGIDISDTSVATCLVKGLNVQQYDGKTMPAHNDAFTVVGSLNVLEHTDNPESYLSEKLRVLKSGGYLIVACPNFLSVTNSYHDHTRGLARKARNILAMIGRLFRRKPVWEKMPTVKREIFRPDDDACNVTNPLDVMHWARSNNLARVFWSSQIIYRRGILNVLDAFPPFRLALGSGFFVFRKLP